jgi:hypothetical protein
MSSITDDKLQSFDYFRSEYTAFRNIMCSTEYSPEEVEDAYRGLFLVYLNLKVDDKQEKIVESTMVALADEYSRRSVYALLRPTNPVDLPLN